MVGVKLQLCLQRSVECKDMRAKVQEHKDIVERVRTERARTLAEMMDAKAKLVATEEELAESRVVMREQRDQVRARRCVLG